MPPNVVYRITTSPATTSATFVGMPVRVDTTDPEAAIWEEVRQNRERILSTAVKILDFFSEPAAHHLRYRHRHGSHGSWGAK